MKSPRHVAIIMDGNGRWANKRGLPRVAGHKVGVDSVRAVVKSCAEKKIEVLTLFAFSTENWARPEEEVGYLVGQLFVKVLEEEIGELHKNNIQVRIIGDISRFSEKLRQDIYAAEKLTVNNSGLKLVIALSYSGRWDITEAVRQICQEVAIGKIKSQAVTSAEVYKHLCLHDLSEPDLLIRTGGEQRLSNFMLWQAAYTELYFTEVLWPDFREEELVAALGVYQNRSRRFGKC